MKTRLILIVLLTVIAGIGIFTLNVPKNDVPSGVNHGENEAGAKGEQGVAEDLHIVKVTIYGRKLCSYCVMAKDLLAAQGVEYDYVELGENHDLYQKLVKNTGQRTVPYVYINGEFLGGYQDLRNLADSGKLSASSSK
jgi:glutaredoxin 3